MTKPPAPHHAALCPHHAIDLIPNPMCAKYVCPKCKREWTREQLYDRA